MIPETSAGFIYSCSSAPIPIQKERDGGGEGGRGPPCLSQSRRLRTEKPSKRSAFTVSGEVRRTVRRTATVAAASQSVSHCACVREPCGKGGCTILGSVLRLYGPEVPPAADQRHSSARSAARASLHFTTRTKLFVFCFVL